MAGPEDTQVGREVYRQTKNGRVRLAMLIGALLEGGRLNGPWPAGDDNTSFGPFQIHLPAHPGVTRQEAENPTFAVAYMLPAYNAGVSQVADSLWRSDPAWAAATAAYKAERPARMYPRSRVDNAWNTLHADGFQIGASLGATIPDPSTKAPGWDWSRSIGAARDQAHYATDRAADYAAAIRHIRS